MAGISAKGVLRKSLPIYFLVDVSGSMYGNRIAAVNEAMNLLVPELHKFADNYKLVDFTIRVITYGNGKANWKIGNRNKGVDLRSYSWIDILEDEVDGGTPADKAIELVMSTMGNDYREYLGAYVGTPLIIVISDGYSNGMKPFHQAVDEFMKTKVGPKSIRVAIGIDTENDQRATDELAYFGQNGFKHATDNVAEITQLISVATLKSMSTASVKTNSDKNDANGTVNVFEDEDAF